jgi:hypothetical protein
MVFWFWRYVGRIEQTAQLSSLTMGVGDINGAASIIVSVTATLCSAAARRTAGGRPVIIGVLWGVTWAGLAWRGGGGGWRRRLRQTCRYDR